MARTDSKDKQSPAVEAKDDPYVAFAKFTRSVAQLNVKSDLNNQRQLLTERTSMNSTKRQNRNAADI